MIKFRSGLAGVSVALVLAACGGGGGDQPGESPGPVGPVAVDTVPPSASVSVLAYTQFANSLSNSEQAQPLGMNHLSPPTSERDPPLALN